MSEGWFGVGPARAGGARERFGFDSTSGPFWRVNSALVASTGDERAPLFAVRDLAPLRHLPHGAGKRVGESARSVRPPGRVFPRKSPEILSPGRADGGAFRRRPPC